MLRNQTKKIAGRAYQVFHDDSSGYKGLMPKLRESGCTPVGVSFLMQARLETIDRSNREEGFWLNNLFSTSDGIAYRGQRFKVVLNAQPLLDITLDAKLNESQSDRKYREWDDRLSCGGMKSVPQGMVVEVIREYESPERLQCGRGALILTSEQYDKLEGEEFSREEVERQGFPFETHLTIDQAKKHPVIRALVRDQHLLDAYVETMSTEGKRRYNYDRIMCVFPLRQKDVHKDDPTMLAVSIGGLQEGRSDISAFESLGFDPRLSEIYLVGKSPK